MQFLITTHLSPNPADFMPPHIVDDDEIVATPYLASEQVLENGRLTKVKTPSFGRFDMAELLSRIPPERKPDIFLAHVDATCAALPVNFPAGVPRVMLVGGATHIMKAPFRHLVSYAREVGFNAVIVWSRHNAHFFKEAGIPHVFWMPGLTMGVPPVPPSPERRALLAFFGQAGKYHPRRKRLIDALAGSGLPCVLAAMPREDGLRLFARSLIGFNASLNGEFNLRVFEAASTGSLILTDVLTPHTGLDLFFRDGESMVTYDTAEDLVEKARYYLSHEKEALAIAAKGAEIYRRYFSREARRDAFLRLLEGRNPPAPYLLQDEPRCRLRPVSSREQLQALYARMALYEWVQEKHRVQEDVSVDVLTVSMPLVLSDMSDLVRVKIRLHSPAGDADDPSAALLRALGARTTRSEEPLSGGDLLILEVKDLIRPEVQKLLAARAYSAVYPGPLDGEMAALCAKSLAACGYRPAADCPGLFEAPAAQA